MPLPAAGAPLRGTIPLTFDTPAAVWAAHLAGRITEADAERLDAALRLPQRQPEPHKPAVGRFQRLPRQRSPDREASMRRRRTLAATWALPPAMAAKLTVSEQAYCRLLADDYAAEGLTNASHSEMAARVGCCVETIKRAQKVLRRLGWITVQIRPRRGLKHLTNVVRIVSPEWITWITNGPRRNVVGKQKCHATENQLINTATATCVKSVPPIEVPPVSVRASLSNSNPYQDN
jgi:hypothetical protein